MPTPKRPKKPRARAVDGIERGQIETEQRRRRMLRRERRIRQQLIALEKAYLRSRAAAIVFAKAIAADCGFDVEPRETETRAQPLDARAHAGDGDAAAREAGVK